VNKLCGGIIFILLLVIAGLVYKFMLEGSVEQGSDGRASIQLTASEKDLVLSEMRSFLNSIQQIIDGVNKNDMTQVETAARRVGQAAQEAVPGTLMGKLPIAFKQLGFDTHAKFDQLALDASQFGDRGQALEQLAILMQNCVACHAGHRIDVVEGS